MLDKNDRVGFKKPMNNKCKKRNTKRKNELDLRLFHINSSCMAIRQFVIESTKTHPQDSHCHTYKMYTNYSKIERAYRMCNFL
jgi:hypothetical protein